MVHGTNVSIIATNVVVVVDAISNCYADLSQNADAANQAIGMIHTGQTRDVRLG